MLQNSGFVGGVTSSASQMIQDVHHGRALKRVWATSCNGSAALANLKYVQPEFSINSLAQSFLPVGFPQQTFIHASFPVCASTCLTDFNTGADIDNCAVSNAACVCADTDCQSGWACGLSTGSNAADAASAIGVMKTQCLDSPNIGTRAANIAARAGRSPPSFGGGRGEGAVSPEIQTVTEAQTINNPVTIQNPTTITNEVPITVNNPFLLPTPQAPFLTGLIFPARSPKVIVVTSVEPAASAPGAPIAVSSTILLPSTAVIEQTSILSSGSVRRPVYGSGLTFYVRVHSRSIISNLLHKHNRAWFIKISKAGHKIRETTAFLYRDEHLRKLQQIKTWFFLSL
ncbi:hypothetical protein F5882DRAFT_383392 [Hyaloscypha sp. PMI_1271]|nr:hypothetical protein F5882DRAFT_383392 [Hyaloscypha sp. PMI_1271]